MIVMGLTGNLGCGKTTVLGMFYDLGAGIIDADEISRRLLEPGGRCVRAVCQAFPQACTGRGEIQRAVLAELVFGHPDRLTRLEDLMHPRIRREIQNRIRDMVRPSKTAMIVVDVPLLFEAGFDDLFDVVTVVRSTQQLQLQRLKRSRQMSRRQVLMRLAHQWPQSTKLKRADFIIDNRSTHAKTRSQVRAIWEGLVHV